ncbi:DUF2199 domain-containing protein [Rhodanobacter sp. BL-MT-08]
MSSSFVCKTCGGTHEGLPTDLGWTLPDVVWAIPEAARANQAQFDSNRCQLGDRFFIRCILKLPFNEQSGYYGWGVWVELSESNFYRYAEVYDKDGSSEPMIPGQIANEIPAYPSTLGLRVTVQFQDSTSRPTVYVPTESNHPLAAQQSDGIDNQQYHTVLVATGSVSRP